MQADFANQDSLQRHIQPASAADPVVQALLEEHAALARAETPAGSAHALDPDDYSSSMLRLWALWQRHAVVGIAGLKQLSGREGEIKSMYTVEAARGTGVAGALLEHLAAQARADGMRRLFLETGTSAYFAPARSLYLRHRFVVCAPFGAYRADPNSVFMTRELAGD